MDGDGDEQTKKTKKQKKEINILQRYLSFISNVLSPIWIRRTFQINNGFEWFILGCRYDFLLNFRLFLVIIYISYEIFK